jgi:hypothetical protein
MEHPISETDLYDLHPSLEYNTGDIWTDLPTFGALPHPFVPGLVITPACDLANWQVDTITYLPIVPASTFFCTRTSLHKIKDEVTRQLKLILPASSLDMPPGSILPLVDDIKAARATISPDKETSNLGKKHQEATDRVIKGLLLLENIATNSPSPEDFSYVQSLFGKQFREWHKQVLRNAQKDVHFLPCDRQRTQWSAVPVHSIALFRYPLSIPLAALELAQQHYAADWAAIQRTFADRLPCLRHMQRRPMKKASLRHRFVVDVISRFTNLYGRIGSPDFTTDTLDRFMQETTL